MCQSRKRSKEEAGHRLGARLPLGFHAGYFIALLARCSLSATAQSPISVIGFKMLLLAPGAARPR